MVCSLNFPFFLLPFLLSPLLSSFIAQRPCFDLAEIAVSKSLTIIPVNHPLSSYPRSLLLYDSSGKAIPEEKVKGVFSHFTKLMSTIAERAQKVSKEDPRSSLSPILEEIFKEEPYSSLPQEEHEILQWFVWRIEWYMGAAASQLSLFDFNSDFEDSWGDFPGDHCVIKEGMGSIVDSLSESLSEYLSDSSSDSLSIRLGERVVSIERREGNLPIRISTEANNVYEADVCVVAVPLGVLKEGSIRFNPPLPPKKNDAIRRLGFCSYKKIILTFPSCFWPEEYAFFGQCTARPRWFFNFENYYYTKKIPVLSSAFISNEAAEAVKLSDQELQSEMMANLRKLFGDDIPEPVSCTITRWEEDQNFRGAYSYYSFASEEEDVSHLADSIDDKLFFAGEATNPYYQGSVHGAYLSGQRAAEEIVYAQ